MAAMSRAVVPPRKYHLTLEVDAVDADDIASLLAEMATDAGSSKGLYPRRVFGGPSRTGSYNFWEDDDAE